MTRQASLTLHSQLAAFIRNKPITVTPDATLREAVQAMSEHRIGSVIVVEPLGGRPLGIFTLRDLLHKVAAKSCDLDQMVMSVMSGSGLLTLNWRSTIYQAALMMARHGVHHVIVVDASGRLAGIVSQEDIYEGSAAEPLTQLISSLNDHLTVRIIELTQQDFDLPKIAWSWLSFGSEGRFEQTLSTDQDNGLIFDAGGGDAEALRARFLLFAKAVNDRLATCGFPLCKGGVMASNPELCLAKDEWRQKFGSWLHSNNPLALLNATIYFDFRALYGPEELAEDLREWLMQNAPSATLFLRFMAQNAVQVRSA